MNYTPQDLFPSWYSKADLNPNKETVILRLGSLEKVNENDDHLFWLELTKFYLGFQFDQEKIDQFVDIFKNDDITFPLIDNDFLLKVLVSSALIFKISQKSNLVSPIIALSLVNCEFCIRDTPSQEIPVFSTANSYLKSHSESSRSIRSLTHTTNLSKLVTKYENLDKENFEKIDFETAKVITKALAFNSKTNSILSEEINVLWWIIGEWSESFDISFQDTGIQNMILISAFELYDHTTISSRLKSAKSLLFKSILTSAKGKKGQLKEESVYELVNKIKKEYKLKVVEDVKESISILTPILQTIEKSLEFDSSQDWLSSYKNLNNKNGHNKKYSPEEIAFQIYSELIFIENIS
jgi:hypothetical protein